jgi:hypothetical protein
MLADDVVRNGAWLKAWMQENAFTVDSLAHALRCNRGTVLGWRTDRHPFDHITVLALQRLEMDKVARRARQRAHGTLAEARRNAEIKVARARERTRTAGVPQ